MFEVHTYTLCDGWINCWTVNEEPSTFPTQEAAQAEIDEMFDDIQLEIVHGERAEDEGYDREEYLIYNNETKTYEG